MIHLIWSTETKPQSMGREKHYAIAVHDDTCPNIISECFLDHDAKADDVMVAINNLLYCLQDRLEDFKQSEVNNAME